MGAAYPSWLDASPTMSIPANRGAQEADNRLGERQQTAQRGLKQAHRGRPERLDSCCSVNVGFEVAPGMSGIWGHYSFTYRARMAKNHPVQSFPPRFTKVRCGPTAVVAVMRQNIR
jgi:hypothetical protein